jgi:sugar (pentulose or hexulose) kinase
VEGGFCRNKIFMTLLHRFLPHVDLLTSGDEEASALGAAILMYDVLQEQKVLVS